MEDRLLSSELNNYLHRNKWEKIPSSRIDIVELGKWFAERILQQNQNNLIELSYKKYFEDLTVLISYMTKELIKQNYVICQERGELLNITWICMVTAFDEGTNFMKKVLEKSKQF